MRLKQEVSDNQYLDKINNFENDIQSYKIEIQNLKDTQKEKERNYLMKLSDFDKEKSLLNQKLLF